MSSGFAKPTQYSIDKMMIDDIEVQGIFYSLSIYENIYTPAIIGSITLMDTDTGGLIEKQGIEFTEDIEVEFTNSQDETIAFKGHLNGLKNEMTKDSKRMYVIEFCSTYVRTNEQTFVTKKFTNLAPEAVVSEMLEKKLQAKDSKLVGQGKPMTFVASRRKPLDVIKYVLTHAVSTGKTSTQVTNKRGAQKETSKGTTGFLCWETLRDGYKFASLQQIKDGEAGSLRSDFKKTLANQDASLESRMKEVIAADFTRLADNQDKMRSGAYRNVTVFMDMDTGLLKEDKYDDEEHMTEKQKKAVKKTTRFMTRLTSNERHNLECEKAQPDTGDQSRLFLSQNVVGQNTFDDQLGEFTLPPNFDISSGDIFDVKIGKVKSEEDGEYDEKHSGKYIIKAVAHHMFFDGRAYTKLSTIRTNTMQDDATSQ